MTKLLIYFFVKNSDDVKNFTIRNAYGKMVGVVGIFCNFILFLFKLLAGILSNSVAIIADSLNNLSDAFSGIITLIGFKLSSRPADKEHPFGHARYEYLSGLIIAIIIFILSIELFTSSFGQILNPTQIEFDALTAIILFVSIVIKIWLMVFNKNIAKKISSVALLATSIDSRNDAICTSAVLITLVLSRFTLLPLDGIIGVAIAIFIFISGISILKETISPLLGEAVEIELKQKIENILMQYDGVLGTHDLILHDYGPNRRFGSAHVEMDCNADVMVCHNIIDKIERDILEKEGIKFVIHFDPILVGDVNVDRLKNWVENELNNIDECLALHDFRVVAGPVHTNLIFDVDVPFEYRLSDEQLKEEIQKFTNDKETLFYTVVTIDRN